MAKLDRNAGLRHDDAPATTPREEARKAGAAVLFVRAFGVQRASRNGHGEGDSPILLRAAWVERGGWGVGREVEGRSGSPHSPPPTPHDSGKIGTAPGRFGAVFKWVLALAGCLGLTGCQSMTSQFSQWNAAFDSSLFKRISPEEMADAAGSNDSGNLLQRWLTPRPTGPNAYKGKSKTSSLVLGSDGWKPIAKPAPNPEADAEFNDAQKLFQQGKLADAEPLFARIAKKRKGTTWGENAQYYLAECQFQQKRYVSAMESFDQLHADYPGTANLDKLIAREFEIGQLWLAQYDAKAPPEKKIPWFGRFDGRLPTIDVAGTGIKCLEHVRHYSAGSQDNTLGAEATMQLAEHYMKHSEYELASTYFDQFIAEFPKSRRLQEAQLGAIEARMKGYLGPEYDGAGLAKARDLVKQTMQSFPERQASYEKLYHVLDMINDAEAEKTFIDGAYYKRIGKVASAEYYFGKIPQRWPSSPWAVKAKSELAQLAKMPRTPSKPSKIIIPPGAADPFMSAGPAGGMMGGMMGGMGGMGMGGMGGGMGGPGMGMM